MRVNNNQGSAARELVNNDVVLYIFTIITNTNFDEQFREGDDLRRRGVRMSTKLFYAGTVSYPFSLSLEARLLFSFLVVVSYRS